MVNVPERQEAVLHYRTPDYVIVKAGSFVRCAVTGKPIQLGHLRYWNPDLQEAYVDAEAATKRWLETAGAQQSKTATGGSND